MGVKFMLKVLIVEDEDIIRKGLVYTIDWLSMNCVVVADAKDGEEGLEKILEIKPDVVITDIRMPKMDGIEMVRRAQKEVEFKSLILTSYAEFDYAKQALRLGAFEYLLKPVDEETITKTILALETEINKSKKGETIVEDSNHAGIHMDFNYYIKLDESENRYVAKAIQTIQKDFDKRISIDSIAEELGVSNSYLSRKFKEITGHSFLTLLNGYRIQEAIGLLNSGRYRVYEVSDKTGFSDYKHFCSVFKKYTLMSPTRFVKRKK